jgi:hypothetical protein
VRIKLDENLPESAVSALVDAGHDTDLRMRKGSTEPTTQTCWPPSTPSPPN